MRRRIAYMALGAAAAVSVSAVATVVVAWRAAALLDPMARWMLLEADALPAVSGLLAAFCPSPRRGWCGPGLEVR